MLRFRWSLWKCHSVLRGCYRWYKKSWKDLNADEVTTIERTLEGLEKAISAKDRDTADALARQAKAFCKDHATYSMMHYVMEFVVAIVVALAVAGVVRGMWFELMTIPTGSMRPTFREKDRLLVGKTSFGLNIPLTTGHFYFDPTLVQRTAPVIWSGEGVDVPGGTDSTYFGVMPYAKRLIKRLIGKPGDSLYFYGGKIFGVDKDGNEITELRQAPWMQDLEHIPFSKPEERMANLPPENHDRALLEYRLFNQPVARLALHADHTATALVVNDKEWIPEVPPYEKSDSKHITAFADIFGTGNFAMARLLTRAQAAKLKAVDPALLTEGVLFLQLAHHYNLSYPPPRVGTSYDGTTVAVMTPYETVIPLTEEHLKALMANMYTARFVVERGRAAQYDAQGSHPGVDAPVFPQVPDGTYEFYFGKGVSINEFGYEESLPSDHPLLRFSPELLQKLYNMGIEFRQFLEPGVIPQGPYPLRYAYFRDGDLYLLGAPILKKEDPTLVKFLERERAHHDKTPHYVPFVDAGAPMKDGVIDVDFIRTFGITVPEEHYLLLGDNHARSADSRSFGFVPQDNLEGTALFVFWPMQERFGVPAQPIKPWVTVPNVTVTIAVIVVAAGFCYYSRQRRLRKVFKKLS